MISIKTEQKKIKTHCGIENSYTPSTIVKHNMHFNDLKINKILITTFAIKLINHFIKSLHTTRTKKNKKNVAYTSSKYSDKVSCFANYFNIAI